MQGYPISGLSQTLCNGETNAGTRTGDQCDTRPISHGPLIAES